MTPLSTSNQLHTFKQNFSTHNILQDSHPMDFTYKTVALSSSYTIKMHPHCKNGTVFITKVLLIPTDFPYFIQKLKFLLELRITMTINEAQGQLLITESYQSGPSNIMLFTWKVPYWLVQTRSFKQLIYAPEERIKNAINKTALQRLLLYSNLHI